MTETYDALGRRVQEDRATPGQATVTTRFAVDENGDTWADLTTANTVLTRYVRGDGTDQLLARLDAAGVDSAGGGVSFYVVERPPAVGA